MQDKGGRMVNKQDKEDKKDKEDKVSRMINN